MNIYNSQPEKKLCWKKQLLKLKIKSYHELDQDFIFGLSFFNDVKLRIVLSDYFNILTLEPIFF